MIHNNNINNRSPSPPSKPWTQQLSYSAACRSRVAPSSSSLATGALHAPSAVAAPMRTHLPTATRGPPKLSLCVARGHRRGQGKARMWSCDTMGRGHALPASSPIASQTLKPAFAASTRAVTAMVALMRLLRHGSAAGAASSTGPTAAHASSVLHQRYRRHPLPHHHHHHHSLASHLSPRATSIRTPRRPRQ